MAVAGGGIDNENYGSITVQNSTISGNSAGNGGGIYGSAVVSNSTISDNSASDGGGIYNFGKSTVSNSTISGNSAKYLGGDIYDDSGSSINLVFSTLTGNQAANGGGMFNSPGMFNAPGSSGSTVIPVIPPGTANVRNTIIASNLNSDGGVNPDVFGTFTSNGYNLIGDSTGSTGSTGFGSPGDLVGTNDNPIDPRLAPLDFNGGSTQTIALLPDSPAIGAGDPTVLDTDSTTDQRGLPRRAADGSTDIGAFEFS